MYKIITPNKNYSGVTYNVKFENGIAIVEDEIIKNILINDFGYKCENMEGKKSSKKAGNK